MEKPKEKRRTIGAPSSTASKAQTSPRSSNSISSFFFGQPKASSLSSSSTSPKNSSSAKHHSSQKALGLVEAGKARMGILRQNSNASVGSVASRATASSKGSVRDSSAASAMSVRVLSSNDEQERIESKAMAVSMKLGMWEGGSVAGDSSSRAGTPTHHSGSGRSSGKRSLNRDNSVGSTFSNVSNISNNSNISILSHSSNGSQKSSMKDSAGPVGSSSASVTGGGSPASVFSPAAAAAASRQRYLASTVQQGPYVLNCSSQSMDACQEAKEAQPQPAQRRDDSLRSTASMELMAASSSENSPVSTPRRGAPEDITPQQDASRATGDASMDCDEKTSGTGPPAAAAVRPSLLSAARDVVVVQSALKKLRRSMSPLPNRREGVERARSSWVQNAADKTAQARPRMVKFTSSTKSMGELRSRKEQEQEQQRQGGEEGGSATDGAADSASGEKESAPSREEDLLVLEGVTMVEESEDVAEEVAEQDAEVAAEEDEKEEEAAAMSCASAPVSAETASSAADQPAEAPPAEIRLESEVSAGAPAVTMTESSPMAPHAIAQSAPPAALSPKRSDGMLAIPLPKLTHVEPEPHPVTPVKAEFLAVKLKSTPSMTPAVVTPPATPTSAAQDKAPGSAKKASLEDPRVPLADLVRINAQKAYGDLVSTELEMYLDDAEFARTFRVTRQVFYEMPLWRQHNQKRSVGLF